MKNKGVVLVALAGAGLLFAGAIAARSRQESTVPADLSGTETDWSNYNPPTFDAWVDGLYSETQGNTMPYTPPPLAGSQVAAFRNTIAAAEGTAGQADPYRVCFGYKHTIQRFDDHPAVTGEWGGEKLSAPLCAAAGFGPGCVSTAAGKYQITKPTWLRIKKKINLPDFSPASQDAACDELLRERGAYALIELGNLSGAVSAAKREWASLPGAGYQQGERTIAWLTEQFRNLGGVLS